MAAIAKEHSEDAQAEGLQQLGFTGYEAKVYLGLLKSYPATAYEVSKTAGLARANVYSALTALERKSAVQPVNDSPVRYVPVDPRQLLGRIQKETSARCESLADELAAASASVATEFVWTLTGRAQVHARMDEVIRKAARHLWIKAAHASLVPHLAALREATQRGVDVLVILFGQAGDLQAYEMGPTCRAYLHEGSGSHVGMSDSLVTLTRDFEEAMIATTGGQAQGAITRSRPVVIMAESLIRHEIYLAEIFGRFGDQLEGAFGEALYRLRRKYLPREDALELGRRTGQTHECESAPANEE